MTSVVGPLANSARLAHWRPRPPRRHSWRERRPLAVHSGLLDILGQLAGGGEAGPALQEDAAGRTLLDWMQQRGLPAQKLTAVSQPTSGRGLMASERIAAGESLLHIPPALMITAEEALQQSALRPVVAAYGLPAWSVLALWLAEARAAGSSHPWAPYLAVLPERPGSVLQWPEEHVAWLQGSHLHSLASGIRQAAQHSWAELQAPLAEAEAAGLLQEGQLGWEQLRWAFDVLLTRLVRLEGLGGQEALLPFADFLNHSCTASCHLDWDAASAAAVLRPDRTYRPGEEVLISYGQKTSGQLLLSYGFLPPPGSNPHDACLLEVPAAAVAAASSSSSSRGSSSGSSSRRLKRSSSSSSSSSSRGASSSGGGGGTTALATIEDEAAGWRAAALAGHGFEGSSAVFPLRIDAVPEELVRYAAFSAAEVSSAGQAEELARQVFAAGQLPPSMRQAALELVVRRCHAALQGYASTLEADARELEELDKAERRSSSGDTGTEAAAHVQRRRQVLQLLVSEKRVLHRTVFLLQQELRLLRRGGL